MALVKEYFELTERYVKEYGPKTVLLMQVGSFFEVYGKMESADSSSTQDSDTAIHDFYQNLSGSKILEFSKICELNIVCKNTCVGNSNKNNIVMAGFKDIMIEKYLRKLQEGGYTIVVYTQDQPAKNTTRSCSGIFSPGTYFSSDPSTLSNNITCIWLETYENNKILKGKHIIIGISHIDIITGKTGIYQFQEMYQNSPTTYDDLERMVSVYNPSETILITNLSHEDLHSVIQFTNINSQLIHKVYLYNNEDKNSKDAMKCEKATYQKEILSKFYKIPDYNSFIEHYSDNIVATQALCYLLEFVYRHNPNLVRNIDHPIIENFSQRLILANHSLKQLNIIDNQMFRGRYSSVQKMLNRCQTPMGKRLFNYKFLNPVTDENKLNNEYNITEYIINHFSDIKQKIGNSLTQIKDISKLQREICINKISPKSVVSLQRNAIIIKTVCQKLIQDKTIIQYFTRHNPTFQMDIITEDCDKIINYINQHLIIECAEKIDNLSNFESNFIQSGIDSDLDNKIKLLTQSELKLDSIRVYLNSLIHDKGKTTDFIKLHETEKNHFSLICTSRRCKLLQDSLPSKESNVCLKLNQFNFDYKISKQKLSFKSQSTSNNSIHDVDINELCKNINICKLSMKDMILSVFKKFIANLESLQMEINSINNFITNIDVLFTKADIAIRYNYCKPEIIEAEKSCVKASNIRHCIIENIQLDELYVSNDISLGTHNTDGILLYGTNAVGKTSLIKALGISIVMAQAGLYVPCASFQYKPYNYLFTRIIGNDNLFKGLSTFAVEMCELRTILRLADQNSLILGDELCSGTENTSGISIFVAGLQKLFETNSSFIFATHIHEIVDYDEINALDTIKIMHMEVKYDKEKGKLIYDRKLKDGPGNCMYGLEVCKSLDMPQDFLDRAYSIRNKYNTGSNDILNHNKSHFNATKIKGICEVCNKYQATEVHHLHHQQDANHKGIITKGNLTFHKNNKANLLSICDDCHQNIHKLFPNGQKKVKTSEGYELQEAI
jgi:DNA mismatch repair protein MutS